jgi:hypothetical protein
LTQMDRESPDSPAKAMTKESGIRRSVIDASLAGESGDSRSVPPDGLTLRSGAGRSG